MRRHFAFTLAFATLTAAIGPSYAEEIKAGKTVLLVPFGVTSVDDAKLAATLTSVTKTVLDETKATVEVAKAPLVDILTLIECPDAGDTCIGGMAEALGVDFAIAARISVKKEGAVAEATIVSADGTTERVVRLLAGPSDANKAAGYEIELREKLGLSKATVPQPATEAPTDPFASSETDSEPPAGDAPPVVVAPTTGPPVAEMTPEEARAASALPPPIDDRPRGGIRDVRTISWATTAAGVISLGVGGVFYAMAKSTESDVDDAPSDSREDIERLRELEDRGDRQLTTAGVFALVGVAATATGVGLIVWDVTRKGSDRRISVAPADENGGFAVQLWGRF